MFVFSSVNPAVNIKKTIVNKKNSIAFDVIDSFISPATIVSVI